MEKETEKSKEITDHDDFNNNSYQSSENEEEILRKIANEAQEEGQESEFNIEHSEETDMDQQQSREDIDDDSDQSMTPQEKAAAESNIADAMKTSYEANLARRLKRKATMEQSDGSLNKPDLLKISLAFENLNVANAALPSSGFYPRNSRNASITGASIRHQKAASQMKAPVSKINSSLSNINLNSPHKELDQELQNRLLQQEKNELANNLGILGEEEKKKFEPMLHLMLCEEIPEDFRKETDPEGKVIYFNKTSKVSSYVHPFINKFRTILYQTKFKEDEIALFSLLNKNPMEKNSTAFKNPSLLLYGAKEANSQVTPNQNTQKIDVSQKKSSRQLDSMVFRNKSKFGGNSDGRKSIYKKSISRLKSISGIGDISKAEKIIPTSQPKPQLMFNEEKIFSLNPQNDTSEQRFKEICKELELLKENDLSQFMRKQIYPMGDQQLNGNDKAYGEQIFLQKGQTQLQVNKNQQSKTLSSISPYHQAFFENLQQFQHPNLDNSIQQKQNPNPLIRKELNQIAALTTENTLSQNNNNNNNNNNTNNPTEPVGDISVPDENPTLNSHHTSQRGNSTISQFGVDFLTKDIPQQPRHMINQSIQNNRNNSFSQQSQNLLQFKPHQDNQHYGTSSNQQQQQSMALINQALSSRKESQLQVDSEKDQDVPPILFERISTQEKGEIRFEATKQFLQQEIDFYQMRHQQENQLEKIERELYYATYYYEERYGVDYFTIQQILQEQRTYRRAIPEDVVHAMRFLNISSNQSQLFWLARSFVSLELPNFWIEMYDEEEQDVLFINQLSNFKYNIHPSIVFISKLISQFKQMEDKEAVRQFQDKQAFKKQSYLFTAQLPKTIPILAENEEQIHNQLQKNNKDMNKKSSSNDQSIMDFENRIGQSYQVNMSKLATHLEKIEGMQAEMPLISGSNKSEYITNILNVFRKKEAKHNNTQHATSTQFTDELADFIIPKTDNLDILAKNKNNGMDTDLVVEPFPLQMKRRNSNLTDNHMIVLTNELKLKFPDDIHIMILIHEFLESKETPQPNVWRFRCSDKKMFYWYNTKYKRTISFYPYLIQLKDVVNLFQMAIKKDLSKVKVNNSALKMFKLFKSNQEKGDVLAAIKEESREFVKKFIHSFRLDTKFDGEFADSEETMKEKIVQEKKQQETEEDTDGIQSEEGYKLKYVMEILRKKDKMTEEEIKEKVLFRWPLKFKYQEYELVNKVKYNKPYGSTKAKASNFDAQIQLKEKQKKALSKLKSATKIVVMSKQTFNKKNSRLLSITAGTGLSSTGISSQTSLGSPSDPFKIKQYPPTSFQVISIPSFCNGKFVKEQFNFSSNSSSESSSSSSSSQNGSQNVSESESEEEDVVVASLKQLEGQSPKGKELITDGQNQISLSQINEFDDNNRIFNQPKGNIENDNNTKIATLNQQDSRSSGEISKMIKSFESLSKPDNGSESSIEGNNQSQESVKSNNKVQQNNRKKSSLDKKVYNLISSFDHLAHSPSPIHSKLKQPNIYEETTNTKNKEDHNTTFDNSAMHNGNDSTQSDVEMSKDEKLKKEKSHSKDRDKVKQHKNSTEKKDKKKQKINTLKEKQLSPSKVKKQLQTELSNVKDIKYTDKKDIEVIKETLLEEGLEDSQDSDSSEFDDKNVDISNIEKLDQKQKIINTSEKQDNFKSNPGNIKDDSSRVGENNQKTLKKLRIPSKEKTKTTSKSRSTEKKLLNKTNNKRKGNQESKEQQQPSEQGKNQLNNNITDIEDSTNSSNNQDSQKQDNSQNHHKTASNSKTVHVSSKQSSLDDGKNQQINEKGEGDSQSKEFKELNDNKESVSIQKQKQFLQTIGNNRSKIPSMRNSSGKGNFNSEETDNQPKMESPKFQDNPNNAELSKETSEVNAPVEIIEVKEVKKDLFLWKIESKKNKNDHGSTSSNGSLSSSQTGAGDKSAESKGSSKEEQKENKSLVDGKIEPDDQFKSLFENHFKEKTQKVNVFKDRLPKIIQIQKYIAKDKIIIEEKGEDEKEEIIEVVLENPDVPQFFLTSFQSKTDGQSPQLHQRTLTPQYQTIPLSQKALNKIIFSPLMNNTITSQSFNEFANSNSSFGKSNYNKNTYFNSSFQISSSIMTEKQPNIVQQSQESSKPKDLFPEVKIHSQFINSQIKNQFSQNNLQIQKVKKEVFTLDQFNYSLEKHKSFGSTSRAGSPLPKFDRSNQLKQAENNSSTPQNSVKKILVFPTLQAPTNHLVPSLSPRSPLNSSFQNKSLISNSQQKQHQQSPRVIFSSPKRIKNIQNELAPISQNEKFNDDTTLHSYSDASSSRNTMFINQTAHSFRKNNLPSLPERVLSSAPAKAFREFKMTENLSNIDKSAATQRDQEKQKISNGLYLEDEEKNSKNEDKLFKKQIESISKYQDDLGNYKIKQMLSDLLKTMPNTRFDFQTRITSQINLMCKDTSSIKHDSYKQFAIEAEVHLEYIKIKFLKKKLDIIAFDFIMANLNIPKAAKKTIYDSEIMKTRLYRHLRIFFRDIRRFLLSTKDIYSNLQRMIVDQAFELKLLPAVFHLLGKKFPRQIEKLNQEPIFQKLILFHEKRDKNKYSTEAEVNTDEELAESELISDIESDSEEQNDLNPFGSQFQLMHSEVLHNIVNADKKKQRKLKKYFRRIEKGQDIDKDSDEEKEYYDNIKLYKQQKGVILNQEEENKEMSLREKSQSKQSKERKNKTKSREKKLRKRDSQGNLDEDKSDENNNSLTDNSKHLSESDESDSQKSNSDFGDPGEEILRMKALNQIYSTPKYVFLLSSFLEAQERICKLESQNSIWKLLVQSLGHIHTLYRDSVKRIEVFIDFGLQREDLTNMARRLKIDSRREGDLMWIAYLYCGILLRFSQQRDRSILDKFLQMKEFTDYDSYFLEIVELNRVKRQFIVFEMSEKNQYEYTSLSQWFKLFDPESGEIFFYNPILKESRYEIEKKHILLQEQYRAIEKYKFIEMIDYIMRKLQDEDQKDQAIQFDNIFKQKNQTNGNMNRGTKLQLQRSVMQLRDSNYLKGNILSYIQANSNIPSHLKLPKKQN